MSASPWSLALTPPNSLNLIFFIVLLVGCAAPEDGMRTDVFSHAPMDQRHIDAIQEGADRVCEDTGKCFTLEVGGDSSVQFADLQDWHGLFTVAYNGVMIILFDNLYEENVDPETLSWLSDTAQHEFGHAAGLDHNCNDPTHFMYSDLYC